MKALKTLLLRVLGQSNYLRLTSKVFFIAFDNNWLKNNPLYNTHYFVKNFIKTGDVVIDIGANLGYYTRQFAAIVGPSGMVKAVEPIALYRNILLDNISSFSQAEVLPFALGENDGTVTMGNSSADKHRHGLMRVLSPSESQQSDVYEVPVKNPIGLFQNLEKINYIKCDIEGYEVPVIPAMKALLEKHLPILQIETEGENRRIIVELLHSLSYQLFYVNGQALKPYNNYQEHLPADLIGIPISKAYAYKHLVEHGGN